MASKCWICGGEYSTDYCTACGPPEAWGPNPKELCGHCEAEPIALEGHPAHRLNWCEECYEAEAERQWESRIEDGETFRGGEAAAYEAEQQDWIQRNLK